MKIHSKAINNKTSDEIVSESSNSSDEEQIIHVLGIKKRCKIITREVEGSLSIAAEDVRLDD